MPSAEAIAISSQLNLLRSQILGFEVAPPLEEQRSLAEELGKFGSEPVDVDTAAVDIGGRPSLWHEPPDTRRGYVILHAHGGGMVMGSPQVWSRFLGHLAAKSNTSVLNLGYRLAPEHPHPAARDDMRVAFEWLVEQKGYDPSKIFIGGDSAGASLALGLVVDLRDAGQPAPAGCYLLSPWIDFTLTNQSLVANTATDPSNSRQAMSYMRELYLAGADPSDVSLSPGLAQLAGVPPLHIQASMTELLYDDAARLEANARTAGFDVEHKWWDGVPHAHQMFVGAMPEADESIQLVADWIGRRSVVVAS